jgi:hypothetical protein
MKARFARYARYPRGARTSRTARVAGLLTGIALVLGTVAPTFAVASPVAGTPASQPLAAETGVAQCAAERHEAKADPTVANLQAVGTCEIDRRLVALDRLQAAVSRAGALTSDHATALTAILNSDESGLRSLREQISGETTVSAVRSDIGKIVTDYRVYALVARQVNLVRADDRVDAAATKLNKAVARLTDAIAKAAANGKDVTVAQGHLDALKTAIAAAQGEVAGDAAAVLAQTPATFNAGTAKPILDAARASIGAARTDLGTAMREARAALAALA